MIYAIYDTIYIYTQKITLSILGDLFPNIVSQGIPRFGFFAGLSAVFPTTPKFRKNRRTTRWNPEEYGNLIDCHQPILPQNLPVHQARVVAKCFCLYLCASLSAVVSTGPYLQVSSNEVVANDLIAKFFVATVFEFELCSIGGSCTGQPVRTQGRPSQKSYEMETLPFWQDRFFRLLWSFRWMQTHLNSRTEK